MLKIFVFSFSHLIVVATVSRPEQREYWFIPSCKRFCCAKKGQIRSQPGLFPTVHSGAHNTSPDPVVGPTSHAYGILPLDAFVV